MVFRIKMKAAGSSKTLVFAKLHTIILLKTIVIYHCENLRSDNKLPSRILELKWEEAT
jgi:hypothetical protein